jgi:hypothetical protein
MATLAGIQRNARSGAKAMPPPTTRTIEPEAFNDEYAGRPGSSIIVGLRSPTEGDIEAAVAKARELPTERDRDRSMMLSLVGTSICHQHDVTRAHPSFPAPELLIPRALKPDTIRTLWDDIERLRVTSSPIYELATEEEIGKLIALLQTDALAELEDTAPAKASRVRRYLRFALGDLDG